MIKVFQIIILSFLCQNLFAAELVEASHVREERPNLAGVFVGGTYFQHTDFSTYGFEYHRIVALPFGTSFIAENSENKAVVKNETALYGLLTLNFMRNLYVGVGPGVKFIKDERERLLGRITVGHIIHFPPGIEVTPNIDLDWTEGESEAFVFGITFGKQF